MAKKRGILLVAVLILILVLSACRVDNKKVSYENIKLNATDVFERYMEKYPNTKVEKIELDTDYGSYVYEVKGYDDEKEYEIKIDPVSGDILKEKEEKDKDNYEEINKEFLSNIEDLVEKAIQEEGEGTSLKQWSVEVDDGILKLEVEVKGKTTGDKEYKYNLETGKIIEIDS